MTFRACVVRICLGLAMAAAGFAGFENALETGGSAWLWWPPFVAGLMIAAHAARAFGRLP